MTWFLGLFVSKLFAPHLVLKHLDEVDLNSENPLNRSSLALENIHPPPCRLWWIPQFSDHCKGWSGVCTTLHPIFPDSTLPKVECEKTTHLQPLRYQQQPQRYLRIPYDVLLKPPDPILGPSMPSPVDLADLHVGHAVSSQTLGAWPRWHSSRPPPRRVHQSATPSAGGTWWFDETPHGDGLDALGLEQKHCSFIIGLLWHRMERYGKVVFLGESRFNREHSSWPLAVMTFLSLSPTHHLPQLDCLKRQVSAALVDCLWEGYVCSIIPFSEFMRNKSSTNSRLGSIIRACIHYPIQPPLTPRFPGRSLFGRALVSARTPTAWVHPRLTTTTTTTLNIEVSERRSANHGGKEIDIPVLENVFFPNGQQTSNEAFFWAKSSPLGRLVASALAPSSPTSRQ